MSSVAQMSGHAMPATASLLLLLLLREPFNYNTIV
jgi:hypothetical protein